MNNSYPNAASGMSKVFISEILNIVSVVPLFIAVVLATIGAAAGIATLADANTYGGAFAGLLIAAGVAFGIYIILSIIAFILKLVGLNRAGHDHILFKYAFGLVFIGILLTIGASVFTMSPIVSSLMNTGAECVDVIIMVFVVYGCMQLLAEKGNKSMVFNGYTVVNIMILVNILSVVARLIPSFFGLGILGTILMGIYVALTIVSGLMFLSFLHKASKALA